MSSVMEILIRAVDQASAVLDQVGAAGEKSGKLIEDNWVKASAAMAAAGAALEVLARSQSDTTFAVDRLSIRAGVSSDTIRSWGLEISGANDNLLEMTQLMDLGNRRGLEGKAALENYALFWDTISDATGEASTELAKAGVSLAAVGIEAGNEGDAMAALGYISNNTTSSIGEFLAFVGRTGPKLREMNIDVNDAAALLGILQNEFGMTGRTAIGQFNTAVNSSDGDMNKLLDTLGISAAMLDTYRGKVASSADILEKQASAFDKSRTPIEHLTMLVGNLTAQFGGVIQAASTLAPILMFGGSALAIHGIEKALAAMASTAGAAAVEGAASGVALVQAEAAAIIGGAPEIGGAVAAQGPAAAAGAATAGRMAGTAFGLAMAGGLTVAAAGAVLVAYELIDAGLQKQTDEVAGKAADWAKTATDAELAAMKAEVESKKGEVPTLLGWDVLGGQGKVQQVADAIGREQARRIEKGYKDELHKLATGTDLINAMMGSPTEMQKSIDDLKAKLAALGEVTGWDPEKLLAKDKLTKQITWTQEALDAMNAGVIAGQTQAASDIAAAAKEGYRGIPDGMRAAQDLATTALREGIDGQVSAIKAGRGRLSAAWTDAMDATLRPQEIANEKADILNQIADKDLQTRLKSKSTWTKRHADQELAQLQAHHMALLIEEAQYGTDDEKRVKLNALLSSQALLDGLNSTDENTKLMWQAVQATMQEELAKLAPMTWEAAYGTGASFLAGLAAGLVTAPGVGGAGGVYQTGPTPVTNPYASGGIDYHNLPSMARGGIVPGAMGQAVPILAHGGETVTPAGGSRTTIVNVQGLVRAETPEDIVRVLRRAEAF